MWSMPDKVLRIVASLLGACALGGFVLGIVSTPSRGRLPGEAALDGDGAPIAATEARALNNEELAPPKPPEPIAQEEDKDSEGDAQAQAEKLVPAEKPAPARMLPPPPPLALPDPAEAPAAPPPEDPPF